jgi:hypothetical protein
MKSDPSAAISPQTRVTRFIVVAALPLLVALFGGVRALALMNDLWMDELWTVWHLNQLRSVGEIFSRFVFDNNHPLNSLWMYLVMPLKTDWVYRLLAWCGGTAGIWLAAKVARLQFLRVHPDAPAGQIQAAEVITASLFGCSYLLIVYSSEARGYGPALGLSLLAFYAVLRDPGYTLNRWVLVYWVASILGVLAHAVVYPWLAATVVFTAIQSIQARTNARSVALVLFRWHGVPFGFGVLYYAAFLRRLEIVGGPETPLLSVLGELAAFSLGLPAASGMALALPLFIASVAAGWAMLWRRSQALAGFYLAAMILFPAAALSLSRFIYLFPRYFILSAAAGLLLMGHAGAVSWNSGRVARWVIVTLTALVIAGNFRPTLKLLRHGRGEYKQALRYIAAHTPSGPITLCSDHDGRNVLPVYHHGQDALKPRTLDYIQASELPADGAQWLLVHRLDHAPAPEAELVDGRGSPYRLEKIFLHAPLSGWDWYLYRSRKLLPPAETDPR